MMAFNPMECEFLPQSHGRPEREVRGTKPWAILILKSAFVCISLLEEL